MFSMQIMLCYGLDCLLSALKGQKVNTMREENRRTRPIRAQDMER